MGDDGEVTQLKAGGEALCSGQPGRASEGGASGALGRGVVGGQGWRVRVLCLQCNFAQSLLRGGLSNFISLSML